MTERSTLEAAPFPDGHFHSPINDRSILHSDLPRQAQRSMASKGMLPGIDLRTDQQIANLILLADAKISGLYPAVSANGGFQTSDNEAYSASGAFIMQSVIGMLRPRRIIEVGSGFSTRAMVEALDLFNLTDTSVLCVDPDFARLGMAAKDPRVEKMQSIAQDLDPDMFAALESGDIVSIDSTHVTKSCSDVNWLFFECLPRLQPGVWVHIHDIFWPFEYPTEWLLDWGVSWNEAYLLRAFLQFNTRFQIEIFTSYLDSLQSKPIQRLLPHCPGTAFGELWMSSL